MQRSGPLFAKTWQTSPHTPRGQNRGSNPQPQGSGIMDRIKRAGPHERPQLRKEGLSYTDASPRTRRRLLAL